MEITEIRIKLMDVNNERLQAFCSVTFDDMFVVRDLKIIEGTKGSFVAMPSRKLTDRCPQCKYKNHLRAHYCNQCGCQLHEDRAIRDADGRAKLHADIAHPINSACREFMQNAIIKAFNEEMEKSKMPGYVCRYDELDAGEPGDSYEEVIGSLSVPGSSRNYRRHNGHAPHGIHQSPNYETPEPAGVVEESTSGNGSFGSGIL